ncbi:class I glutamine amidotransferase-like protein [Ascodesmis nigricans]|uniref:Class I glutamine amidotransferase-like protein n=1 Tax=Ascodesmis nigricans TaxID=341454 RepID=A0A4S2MQT3_9PEZI|nr:class I glutamine amidotransferase-like protein [Ascodesmis nigricans]
MTESTRRGENEGHGRGDDGAVTKQGEITPIRILVLETDIHPHHHHPKISPSNNSSSNSTSNPESSSSTTDLTCAGKGTGSIASGFQSLLSRIGQEQHPPLKVDVSSVYVVGDEDDPSGERKAGKLPSVGEMAEFDAVLVTGSKHDAHGESGWILRLLGWLKEVWLHHPNMRFTGVCFGHQLLSRLLGGTISNHPTTWELSHTRITLTSTGKQIFSTDSPHIHLQQFHQDFVSTPPSPGASDGMLEPDTHIAVWGESEDCPIQGFYVRRKLLTTQGHLGYDEAMVRENIELAQEHGRLRRGREVERAKERSELEHDGDLVGGAILRFLAGWDDEFE